MGTPDDTTAPKTLAEATSARDALAVALARCGVTLPSLHVDLTSCASSPPRPLIDLGRCNVTTAQLMTAVLRPETGEGL